MCLSIEEARQVAQRLADLSALVLAQDTVIQSQGRELATWQRSDGARAEAWSLCRSEVDLLALALDESKAQTRRTRIIGGGVVAFLAVLLLAK